MSIAVRQISSETEVEALVPAWLRLHAISDSPAPFNHPAWILTWWRQRRHLGVEWTCFVGHDSNSGLVGALPLARYPDGVVRFAGHDLHDVAAALVVGSCRTELWLAATEHLRQLDIRPTLDVPTLSDDDLDALGAILSSADIHSCDIDPGARIDLPADWETHWASLPSKRQKRMRAERRALERDHGPVRLQLAKHGGFLAQAVDEFWALREASWRARGRYAELADHVRGDAMRAFLVDLATHTAGNRLATVGLLTAGDHLIGSAVLLRSGVRLWYSMCTFAPRFAKYGPGRLLLAEAPPPPAWQPAT